ncbi:type II toxin-antitoxin system RelE family toxin [Kushneria aurantia]|uniref:Type II toxin-antitoxin system RelE/ParE family toxin n=1 Tax=Kushneria aurantia TaxID=504092 RepID=A0ABV6G215_9GAMM|nr:type II toxin-antitoxin system RelE/ParE family toxin [Kushneria aurantia]
MNRIDWTPRSLKQLRKLPPQRQQALYAAVQQLADMPDVHNVKALKRHRYGYRLRVGSYRVLFDWHGSIQIIQIQEVRKRDERTY